LLLAPVALPFVLYNGIKDFGVLGCGVRMLKEQKKIGLRSAAALATLWLAGNYFGNSVPSIVSTVADPVKPQVKKERTTVRAPVKQKESRYSRYPLGVIDRVELARMAGAFNPSMSAGYLAIARSGSLCWGGRQPFWLYSSVIDPAPESMKIEPDVLKHSPAFPVPDAESLEDKLDFLAKQFSNYELDAVTYNDAVVNRKFPSVLSAVGSLKKGSSAEVNSLAAIQAYWMGIRNMRFVVGNLHGIPHSWLEFKRALRWEIVDFTPQKINPELAKIMPRKPGFRVADLDTLSNEIYNVLDDDPAKHVKNEYIFAKVRKGDTRWKFALALRNFASAFSASAAGDPKELVDRVPLSDNGYLRQGIYEVGATFSGKNVLPCDLIDEKGKKIPSSGAGYGFTFRPYVFRYCGRTLEGFCLKKPGDWLEGLKVKKGKVYADVEKGYTRYRLARKLKRVADSNLTWQDISDSIELSNGEFVTGKYVVGTYDTDRVVIADKIKKYVKPIELKSIKPYNYPAIIAKYKKIIAAEKVDAVVKKTSLPVKKASVPVPYQDNTHLYLIGAGLLCGAAALAMRKNERFEKLNRDQRVTLYSLSEALPGVDVYYTPKIDAAFDLAKQRVRLNPDKTVIPEIAALGYAAYTKDEDLAKTVAERYGK
ncbi:hypothetical protein KY337_06285, partial [Candidatus Woesearchaeota archaeon]|nr:hypothetical protein [Candidatus Woesearchaeota archaeon]